MQRVVMTGTAIAVALAGQAAAQDGQKPEDIKNTTPSDIRRELVDQVYHQSRYTGVQERVVYGNDDRRDVYEVSDPFLLGIAQAAVVVMNTGDLSDNGDGTYTLNTARWTAACANEPFVNQMQIGFCSGFLVGTDIVVTAGHCVNAGDIGSVAFVFGFDQQAAGTGPGSDPETIVPASNVYFLTQVIDQQLAGDLDYSVCRVDRAVAGRTPLPVRRTGVAVLNDPLVMVGHPTVLPKKIDDGGSVKDPNGTAGFFMANVDAYGGNSGSMVVSQTTGMIEGILVRGNQDFVSGPGGCLLSNVCPDSGCPSWEEISKTTTFATSIPELGLQFSPTGQITHTGVVGGPFNDESFQISITNPTGTPADYSVSIAAGGQHTVLLDGSGGPISGTVPAGGNASVTATLSGAAGMPAGIYTTTINLDDVTNSRMLSLDSVLEVGQTGIDVTPVTDLVTGGPTGGPFTGAQMYAITSTRPTPVTVDVNADQSWISLNGSASPLSLTLNGVGDMAVVTVGIDGSASGLANGLYTGTVTFDNVEGTIGDTSRMASLDVGRFIYEDANVNLPISDNSTIETTLNIPDGFCVADLDVEIDITHTYIGDLIVELDSPQGTTVRLHDRSGGSDDNLVVTYDDEAGTIPDGPGDLVDFDGEIATGVWTLRVSDNAGGDVGTLNSWKLKIASQSGGCLPVANDVSVDVSANVASIVLLDGFSVNGPVTYVVDSLPANGQLFHTGGAQIVSVPATLVDNSVTYRPNENYAGADVFTYHTEDGQSSPVASVNLGVGRAVLASFPMDSDPGWSREGQWDFGVPAGAGGDPTSGFTGTNVFGYNLNGEYADNIPQYSATTGVLDASAATGVTLDFERWLGVESSSYDHASIEAFDGAAWQQVWDHTAGSFNDGAWVHQSFDISAYADGNGALQLRWIMGTTDGSVTYAGWNLDDVVISGFVSPTNGYCLADANQNGTLEAADFTAWIAAFNAGDAAIADQNLDGVVTPADFTAWIANFNAGCL